jgi:molybdopterin molybdotransferase
LRPGAVVLREGTRLGAFQLGVAAGLDRAALRVARRPRVRIVATGDELRAVGSPSASGQIPDSNTAALRAMALDAGAYALVEPLLADDLDTARERLARCFGECDVLVTVGGASVGDYDLVRPALEQAGATFDFWKVAMKPGKPLIFGRAGETSILGLPGNPVSAQLGFFLFGVPLLRALQGDARPVPATIRVVVQSALSQKPGRLGFYRARLEGERAFVDAHQSSASTLSLAQADVLVLLPPEVTHCEAGTPLEALRLREQ